MSSHKNLLKTLFVLGLIIGSFNVYATTDGTIDATYHGALLCTNDSCTTTSRINFGKFTNVPSANVTVSDSELKGYIWGEGFGWVVLNCFNTASGCSSTNGNFKVANDGQGHLSGYAWGENTGWINFGPFLNSSATPVSINSAGQFGGWAWAENNGWIKFDCSVSDACVVTDWRAAVVPPTCTLPQVLEGGICVTPVTCTLPQVLEGGVCVTPVTPPTPPSSGHTSSGSTPFGVPLTSVTPVVPPVVVPPVIVPPIVPVVPVVPPIVKPAKPTTPVTPAKPVNNGGHTTTPSHPVVYPTEPVTPPTPPIVTGKAPTKHTNPTTPNSKTTKVSSSKLGDIVSNMIDTSTAAFAQSKVLVNQFGQFVLVSFSNTATAIKNAMIDIFQMFRINW